MRTITGKVKFVSEKTKGIRLEGKEDWFNPSKEIAGDFDGGFIGKTVELSMVGTEGNLFSGYKLVEKEIDTNTPDLMKYRAMAISYAKDLCVADKIEEKDVIIIADGFLHYIMTGKRIATH